MKTLLLETSSECALLACVDSEGNCLSGSLMYERTLSGGPELSKVLGAEVKALLSLYPPPFDRIVVGIGPGSFTGTRVGASMASALAFGWNIPLYTVSSLTAFGPGLVVVDARMGGLYIQEELAPPKLFSLAEATIFLSHSSDLQKPRPSGRGSSNLFSPHPEKILARIPGLSIEQRKPNPLLMAEQATIASDPLQIHYAF